MADDLPAVPGPLQHGVAPEGQRHGLQPQRLEELLRSREHLLHRVALQQPQLAFGRGVAGDVWSATGVAVVACIIVVVFGGSIFVVWCWWC